MTDATVVGNELLRWLVLMQEYAAENNWSVTVSHSPKTGLAVEVLHDAPRAIFDRGEGVTAGNRKLVYQESRIRT